MKVLDLFAGLRGWSDAFAARGHEVFTVDIDTRFDVDLHADVAMLSADDLPWRPDVILASPPCEAFSVLGIGRNWHHDHTPKTEVAREALVLVLATMRLIHDLDPAYWVMENPRAKLRRLMEIHHPEVERRTVTYCQLGEPFMKPTDLWSDRWPPSLVLPEPCKNGDPCHVRAPRGSVTGIQGGGLLARGGKKLTGKELAAIRAKVPEQLSLMVCKAVEHDLQRPAVIHPPRPARSWELPVEAWW